MKSAPTTISDLALIATLFALKEEIGETMDYFAEWKNTEEELAIPGEAQMVSAIKEWEKDAKMTMAKENVKNMGPYTILNASLALIMLAAAYVDQILQIVLPMV